MASELEFSLQLYQKVESGHLLPSYFFMNKLKEQFPEFDLDQLFDTEQEKIQGNQALSSNCEEE